MATPRHFDVPVDVPKETDTPPSSINIPASQSPLDVIKECIDTIHRKSVDLPNSDELAQVLLCTQQLVSAMQMYVQAQADREAVAQELAAEDAVDHE